MKMLVKKKKKNNFILKLIFIIIVAIICAFLLIRYFSKNISPFFMSYAEDEIKRITNLVVNYSVNDDTFEELSDDKIFDIIRNDSGEIQLISYNAKNVNVLLNSIAIMIQNNLRAIEDGNIEFLDLGGSFLNEYDDSLLKEGIICEIPFGAFWKNSLLSNIGPKIPIKFNMLGDVDTTIKTDIKEYGINNAFLNIYIEVKVNIRVNLPFVSNKINISSVVPISMNIIQGNIPDFYNGIIESSFGVTNTYFGV